MSFELLRSLYGGRGTNADLVRAEELSRLHVDTPMEAFVPARIAERCDVVLTGNPGDGKSHLVRLLQSRGALTDAIVELDLSAKDTADVARAWAAARAADKPFVLCANEGPLLELLDRASGVDALATRAAELRQQLGRLTVARPAEIPPPPRAAVLVDLADRNLIEECTIERALSRVCEYGFLPTALGLKASQTSAGRNVLMLAASDTARRRLARTLAIAGRRRGGHFTFRQLWQAIALAITGGKAANTLLQELYQCNNGLGTYPIDNLVKANAHGALIEATRAYADPAHVTDPDLDERLWAGGVAALGTPDKEAPLEVPSLMWDKGNRGGALRTHAQLKRYVALAHPEGEALLARMIGDDDLPSRHDDRELREIALDGLRRLYTAPGRDEALPEWLLSGVPLWVGHSYADNDATTRPHVVTGVRPPEEFTIRRPLRAPWLKDVLGPLPDQAWIEHVPSGAMLRVDADLMAELSRARHTSGPLPLPDRVSRFLARVAGWEEGAPAEQAGASGFAILERPRGELIVHAAVANSPQGAAYV
jgi:hypothetical protein